MTENVTVSCRPDNTYLPQNVKKAVILLHGFGSCGADMFSLVPYFAKQLPDVAFFCPDACEELPLDIRQGLRIAKDAYQWFPLHDELQIISAGGIEDIQELAYNLLQKAGPVYKAMIAFSEKIKNTYNLTDADIAFAGFSQGADIAIGTGFSKDSRVAAVIGFSPMASYFYAGNIVSEPPLLLVYGDKDDVIPASVYDMTFSLLEYCKVKYEKFVMKDCGHFISDEAISVASSFLKKNLFK